MCRSPSAAVAGGRRAVSWRDLVSPYRRNAPDSSLFFKDWVSCGGDRYLVRSRSIVARRRRRGNSQRRKKARFFHRSTVRSRRGPLPRLCVPEGSVMKPLRPGQACGTVSCPPLWRDRRSRCGSRFSFEVVREARYVEAIVPRGEQSGTVYYSSNFLDCLIVLIC